MRTFRGAGLLLALTLAAFGCAAARAQVALPKLEARVTDLTGTLTASQQSSLEDKLQQFEARKGSQIAVLILPSTQPEDIAQFGIHLAEAWKIGRAKVDDGAILIIAKDDRTMRIEVGRGLEGALPDITTGRIINDTIVPLFRQGDFFGGVNAGVDQMIRVVDGEPLPAPDERWQSKAHTSVPWPFIVIGILGFFGAFNRFGGKVVGAIVVGACIAFIVWWFTAVFAMSIKYGAIGFIFTLFSGGFRGLFNAADLTGGGGSRVWRDRGGGWGGGGFGGGGGFSGGGGGFGGGGASGRW